MREKRNRIFFFGSIFLLVVCLTQIGCAKLKHLEQLLTLKHLSEEKDQMAQLVHQRDVQFEQIRSAVQNNQIADYSTKAEILAAFGEPIFSKEVWENDVFVEKWLYRYQLKYFDSDKVYLYFSGDQLTRWEYREVPKSSSQESPSIETAP